MMKNCIPCRPLRVAIVLALGFVLIVGILSGCSQSSPDPTGSAGAAPSSQTSGDKTAEWKPDLKTITIRVSNAAGGAADLKYRLVAKNIQEVTGTTTVVQNITGSNGFLMATALMGSAGITFDSVTDSGANKNILACLNGDANCVLANTSALHDYVESGQLIPLVQFNKTTFDDPTWGLDPIPSVAEVGYPDIAVEPCSILCCRKDADPVGVEAMRRIITDYLSSDQGIADMAEIGLSSDVISAEDAYQRLSAEIDTFKMIKDKFY